MKALFEELSNVLAKGEEAVLVTIIANTLDKIGRANV